MCLVFTFKNNFQNTENKKWCLGGYFYFWIFFKNYKKEPIEFVDFIYLFIMISFKFEVWDIFFL